MPYQSPSGQEVHELLKHSEERFRNLVTNIPGAVYRCVDNSQPLRTMAFLSEAIQEISGYPPSDFINNRVRSFSSIIHPQDQTKVEQALSQSISTKQTYEIEYRIVKADGSIAWVYDKGKGIFEESDEETISSLPLQIDGVILEITERKQTEADLHYITEQKALWESLLESEAHYRRLLETASEGVWMFDADSKTTFANSRIAQMLGYTEQEMLGRSLFEFMDEESREKAQAYVNRRRQGLHERHDFKFRRQDGSDMWAIVSATPILDAKGEFIGVLRMITDISERKNIEEALRQSESQLRAKNQELEQTLCQLKQTQSQVIQNEKMVSLGRMVAGITHEINNPISFIYGNIAYAREYAYELLNLIQLYTQHYPKPVPQIQKQMATLDLDFLRKDFPNLLDSMEEGANRIRKIVLSLRNFSRLDEADKKKVNIHEGINSTLLILQHKLKKQGVHPKIQVIQEYGQLPPVECYPSQLNQVFMNILSNAIDAIESQAQPGKITISTTVVTQEEGDQRKLSSVQFPPLHTESAHTSLAFPKIKTFPCFEEHDKSLALGTQHNFPSPQSVVIRIADNGPGIPEDIKKYIFDPFFTTKPVGIGTGLGLSISHSIVVEKHGGKLTCISAPGQGTELIIELPIQQKQLCRRLKSA